MRRLFANGWVVTMDDAGTEHERGWVLVDGAEIVAVGGGEEPRRARRGTSASTSAAPSSRQAW